MSCCDIRYIVTVSAFATSWSKQRVTLDYSHQGLGNWWLMGSDDHPTGLHGPQHRSCPVVLSPEGFVSKGRHDRLALGVQKSHCS